MHDFFVYAVVMMAVAYLVRAVPFTLFRRKVKNRFVRSFLYYIPYAVLTAMTVPAAWYATSSLAVSTCGLGVAAILAYRGRGLVTVSLAACAGAFVMMLLLRLAG
ncbi:MAG: AzlD domain-containing protein [Lachnospiraceae bacterium]|jgi:branched-subunit amino acid transport protein|nr:AzlD domain-containing protein [Lachnospiraceae bacterium]